MLRKKLFSPFIILGFTLGTAMVAWACADYYLGSLLSQGDAAIQQQPTLRFASAVERQAPKTDLRAVIPPDPAVESATACIELLHEKLFLATTPTDQSIDVLQKYVQARTSLLNAIVGESKDGTIHRQAKFYEPVLAQVGAKEFSISWTPAEKSGGKPLDPGDTSVPQEFSLYLAGAVAWQAGDVAAAQAAWQKVLGLPENERGAQETFATYMLGIAALRSFAVDDPKAEETLTTARTYFRKVREITKKTTRNSCGLAAASLGEEARTYLISQDEQNIEQAFVAPVELYLQQVAAGDKRGVASLQHVLRRLIAQNDPLLVSAAQQPILRALLSDYIAADGGRWGLKPDTEAARRWIRILEESGAASEQDASRLALLCYQQGEYVSCARWLQKASPDDTSAVWLMARLLLREGKSEEAARLLAKVVREHALKAKLEKPPSETSGDYWPISPWRYEDGLAFDDAASLFSRVVAEHGVLAMTTQDYTEALDAFLRSGLDEDAAYVAEYVLNTKELKSYVDQNWPTAKAGDRLGDIAGQIRHLLAKRLLRERRWQEAREYFPESTTAIFDEYVTHVQQAYNFSLSDEKRAAGFWHAAALVRENGEVLFFAEAGPRWSSYSGWRDENEPFTARTSREKNPLTALTADESSRVESRPIAKEDRDRRYRAAELAGFAAALLPNNDDRTARILATAGTWLKYREPRAAEPFYKQLVIRCPETALGKSANTLHWFPPEITGAVTGVWDEAPKVVKEPTAPIEKVDPSATPVEPSEEKL